MSFWQCGCCSELDQVDDAANATGARPIKPNTSEETIIDVKPVLPNIVGRGEEKGVETARAPRRDIAEAVATAVQEEACPQVDPFASFASSTLAFDLKPEANLPFECTKADAPIGALIVTTVDEFIEYELSTSDGRAFQKGDVIIEINNKTGDSESMYNELMAIRRSGGRLEAKVISRPRVFDVRLEKTKDTKMGMTVAVHTEVLDKVEVREITSPGAMTDWNRDNFPTQVFVDDWIVAVHNQNKGSNHMVNDMQNAWKEGGGVTFTVRSQKDVS